MAADRASQLPGDLDPQLQIHTDGIPILGTAIGDQQFIAEFLRDKLDKSDLLLRKLDKFSSNRSKYQVLKLSVSTKARHLLRSLPISRPEGENFCQQFDQSMQNFFARTFNLHNPTSEMITQFTLSTLFSGMGILAMATMAPAAFLASLRNLLTEFVSCSPSGTTPNDILATWAFEEFARFNWDRHHILIDQMFNQGIPTIWNHQAFMS